MTVHAPAPDYPVSGAGLGLRRDFLDALPDATLGGPDFVEVAPENWIDIGGALGKRFARAVEGRPLVTHGLSLNLGGTEPLDRAFIGKIRAFLEHFNVRMYTEHLSYCADAGHLYDLMPIPFTEEAVRHVANRIGEVQDLLGRPIGIENVSYYAAPGARMSELEFINAVLSEADCQLLLDVNNIIVNSINHGYDATEFLLGLPAGRICYAHIAGHDVEAPDLRVDTHGQDVDAAVWALLDTAYQHFGLFPTLLERDFNIPPLPELLDEMNIIRRRQTDVALLSA